MPWASFSMLDGPGGTGCDVPVRGCNNDCNNTDFKHILTFFTSKHLILFGNKLYILLQIILKNNDQLKSEECNHDV